MADQPPIHVDVVVIGLGYVGLPLAQGALNRGLSVTGLDLSTRVIDTLMSGSSHIDDISDADVKKMLDQGFTATSNPEVLAGADAVVICVPTPLDSDGGPDLAAVHGAVDTIRQYLHKGMLVVLESTTYPGTTDDEVRPVLETTGLIAGTDFHLAFSPERIDPGNETYGIHNTPKVVGGVTAQCTEAASAFYARFVETVVPTKSAREAETAKLLENTYRHINIALMNEMAQFCHDLNIDLWDVIEAAKTKPFGFQAFYPGPGVGGHCIPIDPNYLGFQVQSKLGYPFRFVELAQEINASMPTYVSRRVQEALTAQGKAIEGARVLLLGVTYKANIADERESPVRPLADELVTLGADISFFDPYVEHWTTASGSYDRVPDLLTAVAGADCVVLLQAHADFDFDAIARASKLLLDTRGVLAASANVTRL